MTPLEKYINNPHFCGFKEFPTYYEIQLKSIQRHISTEEIRYLNIDEDHIVPLAYYSTIICKESVLQTESDLLVKVFKFVQERWNELSDDDKKMSDVLVAIMEVIKFVQR